MLRVRCFGRVAIEGRDGRELSLRSRKHTGLLLYLVSNARSVHTREDLADLLWEGTGPRERHSLSQALYDIRSNLDDLVEVTTSTVRLLPERIAFDGADFERAVDRGAHDAALELYQGDFAPELANLGSEPFDRWVDAERERHRVLASLALRNAQRAAEERGDWDAMCLASLRLVRLNEFDEEAHCALMRGLCMKGDPASALRHYRNLAAELVEDWPTLRAFAERLESSGAVREVLTVPSKAIELVGREREFEQLFDAYRRYGRRGGVVAVTGERGIGKTALLREFARLVEARGETVVWGADAARNEPPNLGPGDDFWLQVLDPGDRYLQSKDSLRPRSGLLVVTGRLRRLATKAGEAGRIDDVILLRRLTDGDRPLLVERAAEDVTKTMARAVSRISAGNPALLKAALQAASGLPQESGRVQDDQSIALRLIDVSESLRGQLRLLLDGLTPEELAVATDLAVLSETARKVYADVSERQSLHDALQALLADGLVINRDGELRLAHPLLTSWIRYSVTAARAKALRERFLRSVRDGPVRWRLAGAAESEAIGEPELAARLAIEVAKSARDVGDSVLASQAAHLASRSAPAVDDRIRAGLFAAEAELDRGRPRRAEVLLRQLADSADGDGVRLQVELALVRSLMEQGDTAGALAQSRELSTLADAVADPTTDAWACVQLAELTLMADRHSDPSTAEARHLELALKRTASVGARIPVPWLRGFTTLFEHRIVYDGYAEAEDLLRAFSTNLTRVSGSKYPALEVFRSVIELRAGRLDNALQINEALLRRRPRAPDRFTSILLNNLGVVLTELGRFEEAESAFEELERIDATLGPPVPDRAHALINQAQARWFGAAKGDARVQAETALRITRGRHRQVATEGLSLLGLLALEEGREDHARRLGEQVCTEVSSGVRTQDDYLIVWFRAALRGLEGGDPVDELDAVAEEIRGRDHLAACKLRFLAARFRHEISGKPPTETDSAVRELRRLGAGWFVRRAGQS